jgi:hypothetical protein
MFLAGGVGSCVACAHGYFPTGYSLPLSTFGGTSSDLLQKGGGGCCGVQGTRMNFHLLQFKFFIYNLLTQKEKKNTCKYKYLRRRKEKNMLISCK